MSQTASFENLVSEAFAGFSEDQTREFFRAINDIRFGSVEITVHDSRVVQIEKREKFRFEGVAKRNLRSVAA